MVMRADGVQKRKPAANTDWQRGSAVIAFKSFSPFPHSPCYFHHAVGLGEKMQHCTFRRSPQESEPQVQQQCGDDFTRSGTYLQPGNNDMEVKRSELYLVTSEDVCLGLLRLQPICLREAISSRVPLVSVRGLMVSALGRKNTFVRNCYLAKK